MDWIDPDKIITGVLTGLVYKAAEKSLPHIKRLFVSLKGRVRGYTNKKKSFLSDSVIHLSDIGSVSQKNLLIAYKQ